MAESSERLPPKPMCDPTPVCPCNKRPFLRVAWWYGVFPGTALMLLLISLHCFSDAVRAAFDPRRINLDQEVGGAIGYGASDGHATREQGRWETNH